MMDFDISIYMDMARSLKAALKGELDLVAEVNDQFCLNELDYEYLCSKVSRTMSVEDITPILDHVNLKKYITVDADSMCVDVYEINRDDETLSDSLPMRMHCQFDIDKFKEDYAKEISALETIEALQNDDREDR